MPANTFSMRKNWDYTSLLFCAMIKGKEKRRGAANNAARSPERAFGKERPRCRIHLKSQNNCFNLSIKVPRASTPSRTLRACWRLRAARAFMKTARGRWSRVSAILSRAISPPFSPSPCRSALTACRLSPRTAIRRPSASRAAVKSRWRGIIKSSTPRATAA